MQLDILPTIEPGLYPSQSEHQQEIENYFGASLLRALTPAEIESLNNLDIFFVVFTNRCGSTFLTQIMHQAGFGIPPKVEVFNSDLLIASCKEHDIPSFTQYFLQLVAGWNKNQQLGFKIGPQQLFWLTKTGLLSHFRNLSVIHSQRRDKVSQAISFYIARQTGQWHSGMSKKETFGEIPYCRNEILQCLSSIHTGAQLANYYTDLHNIPSLSVDYENILASPDRELERLTHFLKFRGVTSAAVDLPALDIAQQRNEDNERLLELFRQDFYSDRPTGQI